jgi:hypothetical protein
VSDKNTEQQVKLVAQQIRSYLKDHPQAADSLAGVVSWWLPAAQSLPKPDVVRSALELLQIQGVVCQRILPDGNVIYAAAQGKS